MYINDILLKYPSIRSQYINNYKMSIHITNVKSWL